MHTQMRTSSNKPWQAGSAMCFVLQYNMRGTLPCVALVPWSPGAWPHLSCPMPTLR
jgi:hypothetical protein